MEFEIEDEVTRCEIFEYNDPGILAKEITVITSIFQIYQSEGFDWLKFPRTGKVHVAFHYLGKLFKILKCLIYH